jgi:hypothetical protein
VVAFSLNYSAVLFVYIALWTLYFGFAASQFYRGHRLWLAFKGVLVCVISQAITILVITLVYSVYFYYFYKR